MTYIVAVANQKGGVAKTTTVVSLAGALIRRGQAVLAIDLDPQANLTLALGIDPNRSQKAMVDVLINSANLDTISLETSIPGLFLAPSNSEMELAERFLPMRQNHERILREILRSGVEFENYYSNNRYDYILLDCPPSMSAVTINALNAAHLLIIPTQPEYFSAHALRSMMNAIRQARSLYNPDLIYRVLITMQDRRNRIHRNLSEQIRLTFGEGLFQTAIDTDTKLRESAIAGMPITHFRNHTRSAFQYEALAQELIQHVEEKVASAVYL